MNCSSRNAEAARSSNMVAILCAAAVNQDGRSSSLTAPNGPSQQVQTISVRSTYSCRSKHFDDSGAGTMASFITFGPLRKCIEA